MTTSRDEDAGGATAGTRLLTDDDGGKAGSRVQNSGHLVKVDRGYKWRYEGRKLRGPLWKAVAERQRESRSWQGTGLWTNRQSKLPSAWVLLGGEGCYLEPLTFPFQPNHENSEKEGPIRKCVKSSIKSVFRVNAVKFKWNLSEPFLYQITFEPNIWQLREKEHDDFAVC